MPVVNRSAIVPHTAEEMYRLVDGIEDYPQFLPWCHAAKELSRSEDEVHATLVLAKGGIQKSFTTCNRLQPHKMIEISLVEGPFQQLEGFWTFEGIGEKNCEVALNLEFEFASRLLSLALGQVFHQIANKLVDAFTERAAHIYKKS